MIEELGPPDSRISPSPKQTRWSSFWERYNSPVIWLLLFGYLGFVSFIVTVVYPIEFVDRTQAGFFEPQGVIAMGVMGLIGVWLSMRTGFPDAWDAKVSNRQRLLIPLIVGILFGFLFLATDLVTGLARLQREQFNLPSTDIAFPYSILIYPATSIVVEVVYRLLPIPILLGLVSIFVRGSRAREIVFWILAILTSLIEPLTQSRGIQVLAPLAFAFVLLQSFGFNFLQAAFFRKYGFLASILSRAAFYGVFHIIGSFLK